MECLQTFVRRLVCLVNLFYYNKEASTKCQIKSRSSFLTLLVYGRLNVVEPVMHGGVGLADERGEIVQRHGRHGDYHRVGELSAATLTEPYDPATYQTSIKLSFST